MSGEAIRAPWLRWRAEATPEAPAVSWPGCEAPLRYAELDERARDIARALRAAGVREGDVVAVRAASHPAWVALFHGVQRCGAVLLPLHQRLPAARIADQLAVAKPRVLLHEEGDDEAASLASGAGARALPVQFEADARVRFVRVAQLDGAAPDAPLCEELPPEAPCALLFTSGTTGPPKGALLPVRAFEASAVGSAELLGTNADDVWLACMPLFHIGGLSILARAAIAGSRVRVHDGFDAAAVARDLDAGVVTGASFVATMLARVLELRGDARAPASLRNVLLGGGPCPAPLLERAVGLGYPVAPTYGLTEACSQVATRPPGDASRSLHAGLVPLPGVGVRVVDADGKDLAPGEAGEIAVRGDILMDGYVGAPEATAGAMRDGWLHTGDVGVLDTAGRLEVLDRREDLIVSGGENIVPADIEAVLLEHPAVREAAVVARPDAEFGARPFAFVVFEPGGAPAGAEPLRTFCRARLAGYQVPAGFEGCDELPRTAAGKLIRAELRERLR